jgi:hypothetical protein
MNRFILSTVLAACAAVLHPSFADDITPTVPFVSSVDRAQVRSELAESRAMPDPWSIEYNPLREFASERSRAEVRAEFINSREEVADFTGQDSGSFVLGQGGTLASSVANSGTADQAQ